MTPTGVAVGIVGVLTVTSGLVLGLAEITGLGIAMGVLVLLALVSVRVDRPRIRCTRVAGSTRTVVDRTVEVHVTVTRTGPGHSRRLAVVQTVAYPDAHTSTVRRVVRPLAAGEFATTTIGLRVARRGVCTLGDVRIEVTDPFGLARRSHPGPEAIRITVLPRIEAIDPPHFHVDDETRAPTRPSSSFGTEFASLREYARGDDLRKVHWRSSARHDELVVRTDSEPGRPGCTVLLDVRADVYDAESFESAVSAAASILAAADKAGRPSRLATTAGFDSTCGAGPHDVDLVLGILAVVEVSSTGLRVPVRGPDPVIVLTTPEGAATLTATASPPVVGALTVLFGPPNGSAGHATPATATVVHVGSGDDFAEVWNHRLRSLAERRAPTRVMLR